MLQIGPTICMIYRKLLASQGYAVCVNYHARAKEAKSLVSEIKELCGRAFACSTDVSNENEAIKLFDVTEVEKECYSVPKPVEPIEY